MVKAILPAEMTPTERFAETRRASRPRRPAVLRARNQGRNFARGTRRFALLHRALPRLHVGRAFQARRAASHRMTTSKNTDQRADPRTADPRADQLAVRYQALFGKPPRVRNRRVAAAASRVEAAGTRTRRPQSNAPAVRLDELMAQIDLPIGATPPRRPIGSRCGRQRERTDGRHHVLVREWRDQRTRVRVLDDGFEWNGARYKSLSAVAKAITGAAWNGGCSSA
jgi:hypothetical protein